MSPTHRAPWKSCILSVCLLATSILPAAPLAAQSAGTVSGQVLNGMTGQPIRNASLVFDGTDVEVVTDVDGIFRAELPVGTYTAQVFKDGFEPTQVTGVEVEAGQARNVSAVLMPNGPRATAETGGDDTATFGEAIRVTGEADSSTEAALLLERKRAVDISDSIGSEEMSKITGSDAAGALQRVTGVSVQQSKYVYVRGLGDRYSSTSLNGAQLPSTEFEKKVVPLDLFPTDVLDKVTVSKSYTVDKKGEFVAGLVELVTRDFPVNQTGSVGASLGHNNVTTGESFLRYGDGLSFSGGGGQALPGTIPDEELIRFSPFTETGFDPDELEEFGEALVGGWSPTVEDSAPVETGFNASYGNSFKRLGVLLSANYDADYSTRDETQNFYRASATEGVVRLSDFDLDVSHEVVRETLNGNLSYRFGDNHQLQLRSLTTELSDAEGRVQEGFFSDADDNIQDFRVSYQQQEVMNHQLAGNHFFRGLASNGSLLEWFVASSTAETDENRREAIYEETRPGELLLTNNGQSGFMFFNDLQDDLLDASFDWTSYLSGAGSLQVGAAFTTRERDFFGRRLRYNQRNLRGIDLSAPPEEIFSPENIEPGVLEIQEITRPTDTYTGDHDVLGAYAQTDWVWNRWRLIGGVRVEDSDQTVITLNRFQEGTPPIVTELADTDVLPSLSLVYQLSNQTNLRVSASRTVNRPEFRELAPFQFTHVVGGTTFEGNPELQRATIDSYDVRWEWFPSSGEVVAASVFYKDFRDPIEQVLLAGAQLVDTFQNVEAAENLGLELEARRNLGVLSESLSDFSFIVNYSFVESEVTLDPTQTVLTNSTRSLVGQPDNVLNTMLEWSRPEVGTTVRLLYNFVDDKVARAGGFGLPDVLEESRSTLDLVYRQDLDRLVRGLSVKLSGSNLTEEEWLWTQGGEVWRQYEPGRSLSLSLSFKYF